MNTHTASLASLLGVLILAGCDPVTETGRVSATELESLADGGHRRTVHHPDCTLQVTSEGGDGLNTSTAPDGTVVQVQLGADPRFGMLASVPDSVTVTPPQGRVYEQSSTRSITRDDPDDPWNIAVVTDETVINGRTYTDATGASLGAGGSVDGQSGTQELELGRQAPAATHVRVSIAADGSRAPLDVAVSTKQYPHCCSSVQVGGVEVSPRRDNRHQVVHVRCIGAKGELERCCLCLKFRVGHQAAPLRRARAAAAARATPTLPAMRWLLLYGRWACRVVGLSRSMRAWTQTFTASLAGGTRW